MIPMGYGEHLKSARYYLEEARKLLERGDPYDAAEEVWAAVKHATIALTMAFSKRGHSTKGCLLEGVC
jgi:HEPN domain-containing protein